MKVPPKRKGNRRGATHTIRKTATLNESPSEKEGKLENAVGDLLQQYPSMKVPPKRKGNNAVRQGAGLRVRRPQ